MMPASCEQLRRRGRWAEDRLAHRCRFPIAPWNTWSNLAYPAAGAWVLWQEPTASAGVFLMAMVFLGAGSLLYHGTKTLWANRLDVMGMYTVFGALLGHAIAPTVVGGPLIMVLIAVIAPILYDVVWQRLPLDISMGVALGLASVGGWLRQGPASVLLSLGVFALAYLCWHEDRILATRGDCPLTGKYGHALWHVLTAIAIALMFLAQHPDA